MHVIHFQTFIIFPGILWSTEHTNIDRHLFWFQRLYSQVVVQIKVHNNSSTYILGSAEDSIYMQEMGGLECLKNPGGRCRKGREGREGKALSVRKSLCFTPSFLGKAGSEGQGNHWPEQAPNPCDHQRTVDYPVRICSLYTIDNGVEHWGHHHMRFGCGSPDMSGVCCGGSIM